MEGEEVERMVLVVDQLKDLVEDLMMEVQKVVVEVEARVDLAEGVLEAEVWNSQLSQK